MNVTRFEVETYVRQLDESVRIAYKYATLAYDATLHDTLDDSYQVAASLLEVFDKFTERRKQSAV